MKIDSFPSCEAFMKIRKFIVKKLFNLYDYSLDFITDNPITIIHGINGVGKTTVLRLISSIIKGDLDTLQSIPFVSANILFDNSEEIYLLKAQENISQYISKILKKPVSKRESDLLKSLKRTYKLIGNSQESEYTILYYHFIDKRGIKSVNPVFVNKEHPFNIQEPRELTSRIKNYDESNNIRELLDNTNKIQESSEKLLKKELETINRKISICSIGANRIFSASSDREVDNNIGFEETIINNANQLKSLFSKIRNKKDDISEYLDRSYPTRLLQLYTSKESVQIKESDLLKKWDMLEKKRDPIVQLGLMQEENLNINSALNGSGEYPKEAFPALMLYIQDYIKKLSAYDDVKAKLLLFVDIINNRNEFTDKKMIIDPEKGVSFKSINGTEIPLKLLSSGEKNNFIMFFELIFNCNEGTTILIDEPEISLHVLWQREFIDELLDICEINNLQAIVATHSPVIVGEHTELMMELNEENSDEE